MKKKILKIGIVAIFILMLIILTGCGEKQDKNNSNNNAEIEVNNDEKNLDYTINKTTDGYEIRNGENEIQFTTNEYSDMKIVNNGKLIYVSTGELYGYLDLTGKKVTEIKYWGMDSTVNGKEFYDGYTIIEDKDSGKKGLLYEDGTEVIPFIYKYMRYDEDEELYLVDKENSFPKDNSAYYINEKNEKIKEW